MHQDHQVVYIEALRAFKKTSCILGYEHPWNNLTFQTILFVPLQKRHIERKIQALQRYKSQDFRKYMQKEFILSLAKVRGTQIETEFAEAFEVIRWIIY